MVVGVIMLLLVIAYGLLHTSKVQTYLVKYVTESIEQSTGAKIQIGSIDFRPIKSLVLNDVFVEDFQHDTLLFCKDVDVDITSLNLVTGQLSFSSVNLDRLTFNLWLKRGEEDTEINVLLFLDTLLQHQRKKPTTDDKGWLLGIEKITVTNSRFTLTEYDYEAVEYGINWTDVQADDINLEVLSPTFVAGDIRLNVRNLSLKEKSGFTINRLNGNLKINPGVVNIGDIDIITDKTDMHLAEIEYTFERGTRAWRDFLSRVYQRYELLYSHVSFEDLAYFNGNLRGVTNVVTGTGTVFNTVDKIEGTNLHITFANNSSIQGEFRSFGLPDFWNTLFEIEIDSSHILPTDLETIYLPWMKQNLSVPAPFHRIESYTFTGDFRGRVQDFSLLLNSSTKGMNGNILFEYATDNSSEKVDGSNHDNHNHPNHKAHADDKKVLMSGKVDMGEVAVGKLAGTSILGNAHIEGTYGVVLHKDNTFMELNAKLHSFELQNKTITNSAITMDYNQKTLHLTADMNDPKLKLNLVVDSELRDSNSVSIANGAIQLSDLGYFGWGLLAEDVPGTETFQTEMKAAYSGDILQFGQHNAGMFLFSDVQYTRPNDTITLKRVQLNEEEENGTYRIVATSDVADASLEGRDILSSISDYIHLQLHRFYPLYEVTNEAHATGSEPLKTDFTHLNGRFRVANKDLDRILKVLAPDISVSQDAEFRATIDGANDKVDVQLTATDIQYGSVKLSNPKINVNGLRDSMTIRTSIARLGVSDVLRLYNVHNDLLMSSTGIEGDIFWSNWGEKTYSGNLSGRVSFIPLKNNKFRTDINLRPGVLVVGDSVWELEASRVVLESGSVDVKHFALFHKEQFLGMRGKISTADADNEAVINPFSVTLASLNIGKIGKMLLDNNINIEGILNGNIYFDGKLLYADIAVEDCGIDDNMLGSLFVNTFWDKKVNRLMVNAENKNGRETPFSATGYYQPSTQYIDLRILLKRLELSRTANYTSNVFRNAQGALAGNVRVRGNIDNPDIHGFVVLDSIGMLVNALNTSFYVHDTLSFDKNQLVIQNLIIRDAHGNPAVINGNYELATKKYAATITTDNFQLMNTSIEHSDALYGHILLNSQVNITGQGDAPVVNINASAASGSELFLPLSSPYSGNKSRFIHFINAEGNSPATSEQSKLNQKGYFANAALTANLGLNDNLKVQIVFDPSSGDVLKASGSGDIKVELGANSGLQMFGEYKLSKGSYGLTLRGVMDKNFTLRPGSNIRWNGAPYNAEINVDAVYRLRASLSELLSATSQQTEESRSTKIPVECILSLHNNISNPNVHFDIKFPSLEAQTASYIQSLFSSQDEKNKQIFSLLMLNRFYKPDYMQTGSESGQSNMAAQAVATTASEILTGQLSNWLSNPFVDVGVSYRPGDEITNNDMEVALSKQMLDDRLSVTVNANMDVGNSRRIGGTATNPDAYPSTTTATIFADFDIEYKLNRSGSLKLKTYSRTDEKIIYKNDSETVQGLGISYKENFNTFGELMKRYLSFLKKK
ncbi:hypothetical protein FACS1894199_14980 [Bacteroidia bacterium]|nr:hypothetical protein FACS1894199_14980 [Bacteroidia bacterium]